MGRSREGFQGTCQTCRAKRCEAATKLQTKNAASFKPRPLGSIQAFPQPWMSHSQFLWAGAESLSELAAAHHRVIEGIELERTFKII